jgi:hypothetical protein
MARSAAWGLGLAALALAGAALADPAPNEDASMGVPSIDAGAFRISGETIFTPAGAPVTLFHFFAIGPDCEAAPAALTLSEAPAHGRIAFSEGAQPPVAGQQPLWPADDPRAHCADRLVATRDATYVPDPNFAGHDRVVVTFQEGQATFSDAIEVNVIKFKPPRPGSKRNGHGPAADTSYPGDD